MSRLRNVHQRRAQSGIGCLTRQATGPHWGQGHPPWATPAAGAAGGRLVHRRVTGCCPARHVPDQLVCSSVQARTFDPGWIMNVTSFVRHRTRAAVVVSAVAVVAAPVARSRDQPARGPHPAGATVRRGRQGPQRHHAGGDGMGDSEITIARNYAVGAAGPAQHGQAAPHRRVHDVCRAEGQPEPAGLRDRLRRVRHRLGHRQQDVQRRHLGAPRRKPAPTVLEPAKQAGYRTGDVTTAELQEATPAVLAAHVVNRDCKGPQSMTACPTNATENGGRSAATRSSPRPASWPQPPRKPWCLAPSPPTTWTWSGSVPHRPPPTPRPRPATPTRPARPRNHTCTRWPRARSPTLDRATHGQRRGFFLQIEGASIDKQDHAANPCGQIGETVEFDAAVRFGARDARGSELSPRGPGPGRTVA